jgi:hypothetical protein
MDRVAGQNEHDAEHHAHDGDDDAGQRQALAGDGPARVLALVVPMIEKMSPSKLQKNESTKPAIAMPDERVCMAGSPYAP